MWMLCVDFLNSVMVSADSFIIIYSAKLGRSKGVMDWNNRIHCIWSFVDNLWCYWIDEFGFTSKFNYYYPDYLIVDQYAYLNTW